FLRAMEVSPGGLLLWGLLLIGFGMLCASVVGERPARTLGLSWLRMVSLFPPIRVFAQDVLKRTTTQDDPESTESKTKTSEAPKLTPKTLKSEARDWLKRIKFQ